MRADLHIHTVASDGCWTPEQLVTQVQARDIGLFAVADHDTTASLAQTEALAQEARLAFLRGVEISTLLNGHLVHVLAYGFELDDPALASLLRENVNKLIQASEDRLRHLAAAGYELDLDAYTVYEYPSDRGGWKALNFLIDQGVCTDVWDYIRVLEELPPVEWPPFPHPAEAITVIRQAGGVPILAHPGATLRRVGVTEETLRPFLDFGIAGLECHSQYHDRAVTDFCLNWCARHGLLVTGGSDCHGGFVKRELGTPVVDVTDLRLGELEERITRPQ